MQANIAGFAEQARERRKTAMVGRLTRINEEDEEANKEEDSDDDENNFNNPSKIEKFKEPSAEY